MRLKPNVAMMATAAVVLGLCACGGSDEKTTAKPAETPVASVPTTTAEITKPAPKKETVNDQVIACMERKDPKEATLHGTEFRGGNGADEGYRIWRGQTSDGDFIVVTMLENSKAAKKAVKAAVDVQHASGGRFMVTGPLGSGLAVDPLAKCLVRVK